MIMAQLCTLDSVKTSPLITSFKYVIYYAMYFINYNFDSLDVLQSKFANYTKIRYKIVKNMVKCRLYLIIFLRNTEFTADLQL